MAYILGEEGEKGGCIFDFAGGARRSKKDLLLYRDETVVVLLNRFPYANGHLLVAPGRHVADIVDLTPEENAALMAMLQKAATILRRRFSPDGLNIGLNLGAVAGAGQADHLHFHIVPRWQGDHNFMTVLGEVRAIPQHIEQTFDTLVEDFH